FELVNVLQRNPALQENPEGSNDVYGLGDNAHRMIYVRSPSECVWNALEQVPVDNRWAELLRGMLARIPYKRPARLALEALNNVHGELVKLGDRRAELSDKPECEAFNSEIKALEIKWLERVFARWTKEQEGEAQ